MIKRHVAAKTQTLGIFGAGAHARDILAIYTRRFPGLRLLHYDDDPAKHNQWIRSVESWDGRPYFLGMNNPQAKAVMDARLNVEQAADALIDPSALVGLRSDLRQGCVLAPNVVLLADVELGNHVHVNYGTTMTRTTVGDYTTIAPGVTVCGDVTIGKRVFIGAGATIKNLVTIGDDAFIRMGSVVKSDVEAGERR